MSPQATPVALTAAALVALVACARAPSAASSPIPASGRAAAQSRPALGPDERLGNIFLEGEKVRVRVEVGPGEFAWELRDWRGIVVRAGEGEDGLATVSLPAGERGYYTLRATGAGGTSERSLAVLEPRDFRAVDDSPFAVGTHYGQVVAPPAAPGTPRWSLESIPLIELAGIKTVRDELPWGQVEPAERGTYSFFPSYDARMADLEGRGLGSFTILNYGNKLYDVDQEGVGAIPYTAEGRQGYANYARALLARYPQIRELEVWNEYNGQAPWNRGPCKNSPPLPNPDAAQCYVDMLKVVYETVKAVRPDVRITGPAGVTMPYGWLELLFQKGALKYLDAVTVHPYIYPAAPEGPDDIAALAARLQDLIKRYNGGRPKPIYFTEIGWPSHEGGNGRGVPEEVQARYLARNAVLSLSAGVEKIFWYNFMNDGSEPDKQEQNFGLIRNQADPRGPFTPKLGYVALAALTRQLTGASFVDRDASIQGVRNYLFRRGSDDVRALWATGETNAAYALRTVSLAAAGALDVTDLVGRTRTYQPLDGQVVLTLSSDPVYVRGPVTGVTDGARMSLEAGPSEQPVTLRLDNKAGSSRLRASFQIAGENRTYPLLVQPGETIEKPVALGGETGLRTVYADVWVKRQLVGSLARRVYVADPSAVLRLPQDAVYGDTFPYPGTRGTDLAFDPPEVDETLASVVYTGFAPAQFRVASTPLANAVNDGASGVAAVARSDEGDVTLLLPVPARQFSAQVDLVPFTGRSSSASRNVGLVLTRDASHNFFSAPGNVRVGVGLGDNSVLRAQQGVGPSRTEFTTLVSALPSFAPAGWNRLRLDVDLDASIVGVFLNDAKVGDYGFSNLAGITHVGLNANAGKSTAAQTAFFDNFSVSPLPAPGGN